MFTTHLVTFFLGGASAGAAPVVVNDLRIGGQSGKKKRKGKKPIYLSDLEARAVLEQPLPIVPAPMQAPPAVPLEAIDYEDDEDDELINLIAARLLH